MNMKQVTKIIMCFFVSLCMMRTVAPEVPSFANAAEVSAPAPITSFALKNANAYNVFFQNGSVFDFVVYDANGTVVEPVEYGKYDDNGIWQKETDVPEELMSQYISKVNYTYSIKKKKGKGTYGTYEVKVKASEEYGGATLSKTVQVLPTNEAVRMSFFFYRDSVYRIKGVKDTFHVEANYDKTASRYLDGVQYVYGKDKKFKKVYKKGTMRLTTPKTIKCSRNDSGVKGKIGPTIPRIKYGKCYVKWRVYKKVKGKKVYSKWKQQHMWMNGYILDK